MTSDEKYKITEEDIKEYDGKGMCMDLEECGHKNASKVCSLIRGYKHPKCPVSIKINEELLKDPEYVKKAQRGYQAIVESDKILKRIRERMEREGKKTE